MIAAALWLAGGLAAAETIRVRGPAEVDSPKAQGTLNVAVALYDAPVGGRLLWRSAEFAAEAAAWRWVFAGLEGPVDKAVLQGLTDEAYAQFESGDTVFKPRQVFHRASDSRPGDAVYEPGPRPSQELTLRTIDEALKRNAGDSDARPKGVSLESDDDGIEVGEGKLRGAGGLEPPPTVAKAVAAPREPSLGDLRLSNDLYFQALREYRTGNARLAMAKLDVALKLNPANGEAKVALERVRSENEGAPPAHGAAPRPEAVRAAQDLYFEALRRYAQGKLPEAEQALVKAALADPTDDSVATALVRLRREMFLMPHVVH